MIRVLHVIGAMDRAGAETMIMNYYRAIDRNEVQFDFLVHTDRHCDYDDEIEALGGKLYRLPRFTGLNYFQYKKTCKRFFETHPEIDIVHGHIGVGAPLYLAAANEANKFTIAHAHSENFYTGLNKIAFSVVTHPTRKIAKAFFACSNQACIDTFGQSIFKAERCTIINNGVDTEMLKNSATKREAYRENHGLSDAPVFGHVARFIPVKNHRFLVEVFKEIVHQAPNAQLLLLGDGPDRPKIEKTVKDLQLEKNVHFLGVREDVPGLLAAMDVFIFPSEKEGLPVSVVEAQAVGLPVLLSDGVAETAAILPSTTRTPLSEGIDAWANQALAMLDDRLSPEKAQETLRSKGFDAIKNAREISAYYQKAARQR